MATHTTSSLVGVCLLALVSIGTNAPNRALAAASPIKTHASSTDMFLHTTGGFGIDTPEAVQSAAAMGLEHSFHYDYYSPSSSISQATQALGMTYIDGTIAQYLGAYECHRLHTVVIPPPGAWKYCTADYNPTMDYPTLLSRVREYLQRVQNDPLVRAYWVLDDWPWYDATAGQVLTDIHHLIDTYTPGRPSVCGFSAFVTTGKFEWRSELANNFSPAACDVPAWYVYADTTTTPTTAAEYDWGMRALLSKMKYDFQLRGWNPARQPLVGIAQAFGGRVKSDGSYQVIPTAASLTAQSQAFCAAGASSIAYYGWKIYVYDNPQTPFNNADMAAGVRGGIAACKALWNTAQSFDTSRTPAVPFSLEAEQSALSGPVSVESYPSASHGSYIQFSTPSLSLASCPKKLSGLGVAMQRLTVSVTGRYYVWSRITTPSDNANSYWLQIDDGCPVTVGDSKGMDPDVWNWVNYRDGNPSNAISLSLTAGPHTIRMISRKAVVNVDRIIFTPDRACVPTGTGDDCLPISAPAQQVPVSTHSANILAN
ncbi:MAG: hypothetical protein NVSMB52_07280 [Chloroflexota bacterium]